VKAGVILPLKPYEYKKKNSEILSLKLNCKEWPLGVSIVCLIRNLWCNLF